MSTLATILVSVAGSSVLSAIVTGFLTFNVNRASAAKLRAEAEKIATEKASLAQKTALDLFEATNKVFETTNKVLETRCGRCETQLAKVEGVVLVLIDATEAYVTATENAIGDVARDERLMLRSAIWAARQAV